MHPVVPAAARRRNFQFFCLACAWALSSIAGASAQTLAFPGAVGVGQYATGGRNGSVYHVTSLADSGSGTFRDAVSQPNRTIVFDVGGTITLDSTVACSDDLTIAGQTAPGGGIAIIGHEVSFSVLTNEIVRFLRFRPGSIASSTEDGIDMGDGTNLIFDHISVEFAPYNNIDAHGNYTGGNQITIQNSILAEPISQQFNAHTEAVGNTFTWYCNIFSSGHDRNPMAKVNTIYINNVVYNYQAGYTVASTEGNFSHDIVNNYFITGPATTSPGDDFDDFNGTGTQVVYASGNLLDSNDNGVLDGSPTAPAGPAVVDSSSPWSTLTTNIPTVPTAVAFRNDISSAGALPHDQMDQLVMAEVSSVGTVGMGGGLWSSQTQTGLGNNGYGVINGGTTPINTSGDGIADYWKLAIGLNPNIYYPLTNTADGYTLLEHYINWLATPHAVTGTNTPVNVDLTQYTGGYTNASPVFNVSNGSNGVVALNSGHIAQFTPAANFSGLGSFQFTVASSDGDSYTNAVIVLVTPIAPIENLVWRGDGIANLWTNGGPANWWNGTNLVSFAPGDNVTFDDTGSNTPPIDLSGSISAGTVYVLANNQNYTFAGTGFLAGGTGLFKTGAAQLTLDTTNTFTGGATINDGVLQVGDGVSFSGGLGGIITNNSTLIFATPGNLASSASISGSGALTETGPGSLTLSGTETYTGPTAVNSGALTFSGTVPPSNITNDGSLTLAPSASQIYGNVITGPGAVSVNAAAVLNLSGANLFSGNLTNNGGFLVLSNNSAAGSGTVVFNGGFVVVASGTTVSNNFYIPSATTDLNMMATNTGTGVWAGNVILPGGGAQWRPGSDGGTLMFLGNAAMGSHIFVIPRGAVTFASNAVATSTTSGFFGRDSSNNKRSLNLTIRDNAAVAMAGCSFGGDKTGGSVTVTVQNNASLSFGANTIDLNDVNNSAAISTLRLNGGTTTVGGFTKTMTANTNIIDFNGGVLVAAESNASFLPAFNPATNAMQAGGAVIDDGGFAITIAGPLIHDPALGSTLDGGLTKLDTGTLTLTANDTYTGPTIINAGTLALSGAGAIGSTTNIYVSGGALFDVSSLGAYTVGSGTKLWGNGSVKGNLTLAGGATLAPGSNSFGALTFSNSLTLASGSACILKISHSPLTNDTATMGGTWTRGGALIVTNTGGAPLAMGDTFKLFNFNSYSGAFASVRLPPLPFGLLWNTNNLDTAGTISVMLDTTPVFGSISVSGSRLGMSGTGGVGNAYYVLLGATNLSTGGWTPLMTNQFDNSGNFNLTNNINTGNPLNFYRLQMQ